MYWGWVRCSLSRDQRRNYSWQSTIHTGKAAGNKGPRHDALRRRNVDASPRGLGVLAPVRVFIVRRDVIFRCDPLAAVAVRGRALGGDHWQCRVARVIGVVLLGGVVYALQVERRGRSDGKRLAVARVGRDGPLAQRIETVHELSDAVCICKGVLRVAENLVADGPNNDARVVAVAQHEQRRLPVLAVAVVLVPRQEAELVEGVKQSRVGGVVRRPPAICADRLELRHAMPLHVVRHCDADRGRILVI